MPLSPPIARHLPSSPLRFAFTFSPNASPTSSPNPNSMSPSPDIPSLPTLPSFPSFSSTSSASSEIETAAGLPPASYAVALAAAQQSQGRRADLRKEVAIKVHNSKQFERRARFLARIAHPPSPRAATTPATPPDSPSVFYYSLPSPGLASPLSLDSPNGGGGGAVRREEVDFRERARARARAGKQREGLGLGSPTSATSGARTGSGRRAPPTLGQIAARLQPSPTASAQPRQAPRLYLPPRPSGSADAEMDDYPSTPTPPSPSPISSSATATPFSLSSVSLSVDLHAELSPSPPADAQTGKWPDTPYPPSALTPALTLTPASTPTPSPTPTATAFTTQPQPQPRARMLEVLARRRLSPPLVGAAAVSV